MSSPTRAGTVYLIGGGPGDPGLLTLRAAEVLASVDVVLHDELVHPALLEHCRADAVIRHVGKRGGGPAEKQAKQSEIEAELCALALAGRSVARLKGGDPYLFGRGSEEAEALVRAGVPFEVVPGVPSPIGATAYAGISLTHRDLASSVTFVSGTTRCGAAFDWSEVAALRGTLCVLMGMQRLEVITADLVAVGGRDPTTPAAVIQWGTRAEQRVVRAPLEAIAGAARAASLGSPGLLVVGAVADLRSTLRWFDRRPLFGRRVLVTRPEGQASATARMVRARGGEPVMMPTTTLVPPPDPARVLRAVRELDTYDLCAFTSENAVDRFFEALEALGRDARAFGRARVAAVGSGTAAALLRHGVRADLVPATFRGDELARAILEGDAPPRRVLLPRALVAREALPEVLRAAGVEVDIVPVYETRPAPREQGTELVRRLEASGVDVVLLTASSAADAYADLLGDRAQELGGRVLVASIGPVTTDAATRRGLAVAVTSTVSTISGLLDAVEAHLGVPEDLRAPR